MEGKYDSLKDPPDEEYTGDKYVEQVSVFIAQEQDMMLVRGFPPCPECDRLMPYFFLSGIWFCPYCKTRWDKDSLAKAIKKKREVAELYKEE